MYELVLYNPTSFIKRYLRNKARVCCRITQRRRNVGRSVNKEIPCILLIYNGKVFGAIYKVCFASY